MTDAASLELRDEPAVEASPKKKKPGRPKKVVAPANISIGRDSMEQKLDHFQYTRDEKELDWWEGDSKISPLHVPEDVKKATPGMAHKWISLPKQNRVGVGYHGWQIYKDKSNPDGVRRGNDLILAVMPLERAEKYRKYVSESSSRAVRGMQEKQIERIEAGINMGQDATKDVDGGTFVGRRPKVGKGGGYSRGYDPEYIKEVVAKNRERLAKNRKYFV